MLKEVEDLIYFIQNEYISFNEKWQQSIYYSKINLKNNLVYKLVDNEELLNCIFNYREFINENNIQLLMDFKEYNNKAKINVRTKTKNSIEFKIDRYIKEHENGEIPISKCLNDLFGIRIICDENIKFEEIKRFIEQKYPILKCINSSKKECIATHIYFKQDNLSFPWELQIWNKEDEISNIISHEKYKQGYVKWEEERRQN